MAGLFVLLFFLKIYTDRLPDYGIRSQWKKLLLKTMVPDDVPKISVMEASGKKESVLFLDTRTKEEYRVSHLAGARFVGYSEFNLDVIKDVPKEQPIITYCSIGKRSGEIGKKLLDAGYLNVQNLYGGIFEWVNGGNPVVDAENKLTENVHVFSKAWGRWLDRGHKVY